MFQRGAPVARAQRLALALAALAAGLVVLAQFAGALLPDRVGPPLEQLTVERTSLEAGTIELTLRNTGADPVQVAQVFVNDSYVDFTGGSDPVGRLETTTLRLRYPWQEGVPYTISMLSSSGAVIEHHIDAAAATPPVSQSTVGRMALIGVFIGVVPVLLGLTLLPALSRSGPTAVRGFLAVSVGMLGFLAVDAALEGSGLAAETSGAFGGPALVALGAALAFLVLAAVDRVPHHGTAGSRLALLIAIGIGVHNLGEGLAVGSAFAVGELAIGTSLVVGFAAHNATEGFAIVAPLVQEPIRLGRLFALGLIAGLPAILGTVLGATVTTPAQAAFLLGCGVGAIAQVIVRLIPLLRRGTATAMDLPVVAGLAGGVLLMYLTGLLVPPG